MQQLKNYKVDYLLYTYIQKEGQTVAESEEIRQVKSDTDNLKYLFTDLLDMHRLENLKGLKILNRVF